MNPVRVSLRHPQVTVAITVMALVAGLYALLRMPRREDPKITIHTGIVAAFYPGATAEEVEMQVTRKIEDRLFRTAGVRREKTFSTSRNCSVFINVELEDHVTDTDTFWSKIRLDMAQLKMTELPEGLIGPVVDSDFGDTVALLIAIHGDRYGYRELKEYSERIETVCREPDESDRGAARAQHGAVRRHGANRARGTAHRSERRVSNRGADPKCHDRRFAHGSAGIYRGSGERRAGV